MTLETTILLIILAGALLLLLRYGRRAPFVERAPVRSRVRRRRRGHR